MFFWGGPLRQGNLFPVLCTLFWDHESNADRLARSHVSACLGQFPGGRLGTALSLTTLG